MERTFCTIITIGDELLIGQTIDTNSAWIAQQLNPLGIAVKRRVAVGDIKEDIIDAINYERKFAQIIILTGGLGPTSDDITKPLLCEYFNTTLIQNEKVLHHIQQYFASRNRPMLDVNLQQAMLPKNCEVLFNAVGTAPGMLFRDNNQMIISLPGVPFEMQYLISTHVLDILKNNFQTPNFLHKTLVTSGEGESYIAERLKEFEKNLPESIKIAYLPKLNMVKIRLTAIDIEISILDKYFQELKSILKNITVSDSDLELEQVIAILSNEKNITISVAESCTGGSIASRITSIKGASIFFKGGIVPYSIESKENILNVSKHIIDTFGVVSEQTVISMAQQCCKKFNTDFALSVSGYLEKNDHDNSVWIGMSNTKKSFAKKIIVPYDREKNTVLVCNAALNMFRIFIEENS